MAKSTLGLAFTQSKKSLVVTGLIGIRESVTVTVTDGAALIAGTLVLKIQDKNNRGLTTPIAFLSTWAADGDDAVGTLNTNTTQAIAAFVNKGNQACQSFNILLYVVDDPSLQANSCIKIKNFPSAVSADPITLDQCETIASLTARIVVLEDAIANDVVLYADFSAVTDLASNSSIAVNRNKINSILGILRDD